VNANQIPGAQPRINFFLAGIEDSSLPCDEEIQSTDYQSFLKGVEHFTLNYIVKPPKMKQFFCNFAA